MTTNGSTTAGRIEIVSLTKRFGDVAAVDDISLDIPGGEFFSMVGPSGCGKTTTLRMIAGFERPDEGEIRLDGVDMSSTPPHKRNVNTVFQSYALFPHLSVAENVAFGLRYQKTTKEGQRKRVAEALARVAATTPDVVVVDVRLPDGDGVSLCRALRALDPAPYCLVLTAFDDERALVEAIMAGASGYVLKQIRGTDLVDAVRRVAAGQSMLDPAVTQRVLERIRNGVEQPKELESLSAQERRLLDYIAQGLTNREIAAEMFLAEKTVKNYVSGLLAKLGLERRTQAAVLATRLIGKHP